MKQMKISGRNVLFNANSNLPKLPVIKQVFGQLPKNDIPVVFETKQQYIKQYAKNQEKKNKVDFTPQQEKAYLNQELTHMQPVVSRYTTKHNPYMEPKIVVFTDKPITKPQLQQALIHETGHVLYENKPKLRKKWQKSTDPSDSPTVYGTTNKSEDFAESYTLAKLGKLKFDNDSSNMTDSEKRLAIINADTSSQDYKLCPVCRSRHIYTDDDYCSYCRNKPSSIKRHHWLNKKHDEAVANMAKRDIELKPIDEFEKSIGTDKISEDLGDSSDYNRHAKNAKILNSQIEDLEKEFKEKASVANNKWTPRLKEIKFQIENKQKAFQEEADLAMNYSEQPSSDKTSENYMQRRNPRFNSNRDMTFMGIHFPKPEKASDDMTPEEKDRMIFFARLKRAREKAEREDFERENTDIVNERINKMIADEKSEDSQIYLGKDKENWTTGQNTQLAKKLLPLTKQERIKTIQQESSSFLVLPESVRKYKNSVTWKSKIDPTVLADAEILDGEKRIEIRNFISSHPDAVTKTIAHEELHNALQDVTDKETSVKLDNIAPKSKVYVKGKILQYIPANFLSPSANRVTTVKTPSEMQRLDKEYYMKNKEYFPVKNVKLTEKELSKYKERRLQTDLHNKQLQENLNPSSDVKSEDRKVIEDPQEKNRRINRGYTNIMNIDAKKFAEQFKHDQGEDLAWNQDRLISARAREYDDSYPEIYTTLFGKVDVNDGRHRIAAAAEKNERIDVAVKTDKTSEDMAVISKTTVPVIDDPTQFNTVKNKLIVNMAPQKVFDTLQAEFIKTEQDPKVLERLKTQTPEEFRQGLGGIYQGTVKEYKAKLQRGEDVPTGYILKSKIINDSGKVHDNVSFDTMSGVEAARQLGIPKIPIVLAEGRTFTSTGFMRGDWEFSPTELANKQDEERRTTVEAIRREDTDKATIHHIHTKRLKPGAKHGSIKDEDYEDSQRENWREVTEVDLTKMEPDSSVKTDKTSEDMAFKYPSDQQLKRQGLRRQTVSVDRLYKMRGDYGRPNYDITWSDRMKTDEREKIRQDLEDKWTKEHPEVIANDREWNDYLLKKAVREDTDYNPRYSNPDITKRQITEEWAKRKLPEMQAKSKYQLKDPVLHKNKFDYTVKYHYKQSPEEVALARADVMSPHHTSREDVFGGFEGVSSPKSIEYVEKLAEAIKNPEPLVEPINFSKDEVRENIIGEGRHRILASQIAGEKKIDVLVPDTSEYKTELAKGGRLKLVPRTEEESHQFELEQQNS